MGTILDAKFPGHCEECGDKFTKGERFYYSKDPKISCKNETCAKEQGWEQSSSFKGGFRKEKSDKPFWNRPELTAQIPEGGVIEGVTPKYMEYLRTADAIVGMLYPKLKDNDANTFGQIRSKILDQLIAIHEIH